MSKEVKILLELVSYMDENGLLCQQSGDGGDSCNRTMASHVYYKELNFEHVLKEGYYQEDLKSLTVAAGRYCRNPFPTGRWFNDPDNFTRDQSIVLQAAMVMHRDEDKLRELWGARKARYFFHFNDYEGDDTPGTRKKKLPDPPAPIEFAQFIRGLGLWYLWPVLVLLDLQLLIDVLLVRPITKRSGNKDFDVQYLPILLSCLSRYATPTGVLAKFCYSRTTTVESELRRYFAEGPGLNGLAPLAELAILAYRKGIKNEPTA